MRKWRIKSRKILATLLAAVMLLVMIPTTMVDMALAANYVTDKDGNQSLIPRPGRAAC